MSKKTVIFFPFEDGSHVTRSLAIAVDLQKLGVKVLFALPKGKQDSTVGSGIEVIDAAKYNSRNTLELTQSDLEILKKYKPNYVVVDFRLATLAAAKALDIPVVFISGGIGLPYQSYIPSIPFPAALKPIIQSGLYMIATHLKKSQMNTLLGVVRSLENGVFNEKVEEILNQITFLIPESKDYLPTIQIHSNVRYINPIFWQGFETIAPKWLDTIYPTGKTIYLTFGNTGLEEGRLVKLSITLAENGYRVVVSTGKLADPLDFPQHPNLFVAKFLPGFLVSQKVDLVICHGGYGTMMQAALSGKPTLSLPFNPDQILHSLRFRELGLGICLMKPNIQFFISILSRDWELFKNLAYKAPIDDILTSIREILKGSEIYKQNILKFQKQFTKEPGSKQAANIIQELLQKV